jgi:hypothetical protein
MIIFNNKNKIFSVTKCYPLFDYNKSLDKQGYNTTHSLTLFGFCFTYEIIHYKNL